MKLIIFYLILFAPILSAREATKMPSESKLQLLYFTASWCGPCQLMKQETWPSPLVQKALDNFDFMKVDVDAHRDRAREWSVRSMPTYLIVDASGRHELARMSGFMDAHRMATWLDSARTRAQAALDSIVEAEALFQARWKKLEPLHAETITTEALTTARAALYGLLERRGDFSDASARELDQTLAEIARAYPQRLAAGILHPDLQVRAYTARALNAGGHFFNPWDRFEEREKALHSFIQEDSRSSRSTP